MERRQDTLLGLIFAAIGVLAAVQAAAYPGASGHYPMALGAVLAALGGLIALRARFRGHDAPRLLINHGRRAAATVALGAGYLALVPLLGFYTASTLAVLVIPVALGFRRPVYLAATTIMFVALVWLVFSVVLEKPLPGEFWFP